MVHSRPLKILHLIPNLRQGGAEAMLSSLVNQPQDGIEHAVCTMMQEPPFFKVPALHQGPVPQGGRINASLIPHLSAAFSLFKPDIVQAWMYHANFASTLFKGRAKIVWSIHSTHLNIASAKPLTRWIDRSCAALSRFVPDKIIYVSAVSRNEHEASGYSVNKSVVIPNGIDLQRFAPRVKETKSQLKTLLLAGRFSPEKGHHFFVECLSKLHLAKALRLIFVGDGCNSDALKSLVSSYGLSARAEFHGAVVDIERFYAECDILVLPSLVEALPMVVLEAAAMGKAVVASRVGEIPHLGFNNACLFEPGDSVGLAHALAFALNTDPDVMARDNQALAQRYSIAQSFERYRQVYQDLAMARV